MEKSVKVVKLSDASEVAKTISNKTAQSIIESIASSKKRTATQLSKDLNLPASTVHYNMKALVKAGIVDDSEFTYSKKGKTIIHYTLTNNILIIIPESQDEFSILQSLKALVPSFLGVAGLGVIYYLLRNQVSSQSGVATQIAASNFAYDTDESAAVPESFTDEVARSLPEPMVRSTVQPVIPDFIWGLLIATVLITLIFLVSRYLRSKKK